MATRKQKKTIVGEVIQFPDNEDPGQEPSYYAGRHEVTMAWAEWLHSTGYPYDWCTPAHIPPDQVMQQLVDLWLASTKGVDGDRDALEADVYAEARG